MPEPASRFIPGAAGRLHLRDFGGAGPVVLALHGVTGGAFLWEGVAAALEGRCRLLALDFRGHGLSDWSAALAYSTDAYVEDLEAALAALALPRPPVLMGASWGALAAIRLAARLPGAAAGLVVVDVEPSFQAGPGEVPPRPYRFADLAEVEAWERRANPAAPPAALAGFARGSVTRTEEGAWLRRHDPFFLTCWPFRADDLWPEIPAAAVLALIVHGARSFVREAVCRRMAAAFPQGAFAQVADAGHLVALEQPGALAALLDGFLSRLPAQATAHPIPAAPG